MPGIETYNDTATIANGESLSTVVHLGQRRMFGLQLPTITSAVLTFSVSYDGETYVDLYDDAGTEVSLTVSTGARFVVFSTPAKFLGVQRLKIRSGTSGTPVNQGAERLIRVVSLA